ncbi:4'-phosphopantetheinyl transferase family protein [Streptomyces sp. NPDC001480]|uniref:4'-phosphopantetheinyl transferase family protein n=1 Tax=Streptomyces sp. NPDC001480 TaxID=3364577 RepID=UPI0036C65D7D
MVHSTWGEWFTAALLDPGLNELLGRDRPRYRQTADPAGRLRFAVSRVILKHAAAQVLNVAPTDLDLAYQLGGRPTLRGLGEELHLSLAHTDDLVVVGLSGAGPVGVDAESVTRRISLDLLRDHVCTPREAEALAALPDEESTAAFLRLWTLKEAYTKALGQGMRRRFAAVGFRWEDGGAAVLEEDSADAREWTFVTHLVQGGYLVSEAHRAASALALPGAGSPGGR